MNFITSARIILIGIILITASGCKPNGDDSSAVNENSSTAIKIGIVEESYEPEDSFKIPEYEQSLFVPEKKENTESNNNSSPVPEPLTVLLLGPVLLGLLALKKREKHAS